MKRILSLICLLLLAITMLNAELVNVNPDPNGDPWYVVNEGPVSIEEYEMMNAIPQLEYTDDYITKDLPVSVDNSINQYFRPVFLQQSGSCAQAAGVGYAFTYEMNFERGFSSSVEDNQYPPGYTYNFENDGSGVNGSNYITGWEIIKQGGCPNVTTYGGMYHDNNYWMSGYDNSMLTPSKVRSVTKSDSRVKEDES